MNTNEITGTILDSYEDETGQELAALAEKHPVEGAALAETLREQTDQNGNVLAGSWATEAITESELALRRAGR